MCKLVHSVCVRLLLGAFLVLGSTVASAQTAGRGYVGGGIASVDGGDCPEVGQSVTIAAGTVTYTDVESCEDRETTFNVFVGYQVNQNFAIELGHVQADGFDANYTATVAGSSVTVSDFAMDISTLYLASIGRLPLDNNVALTARIGVNRFDVEGCGTGGTTRICLSGDGTKPLYGIGADYDFSNNFRGQVTLTRYEGEFQGEGIETDIAALNLVYLF